MTIEKDKNFYYKDEKNNIQMDDNGSMIKTHVLPKMMYLFQFVILYYKLFIYSTRTYIFPAAWRNVQIFLFFQSVPTALCDII